MADPEVQAILADPSVQQVLRDFQDCEKALDIDPKYLKAWSRKGAVEFFMKEYKQALDSYGEGLKIDPNDQTCKEGMTKTQYAINSGAGGNDKERAARGMADPEVQAILADPSVQQVLRDFQENPQAAQHHLQQPVMMEKINKLIAAGVLQTK
jgi:stress-induced-phosphoprotein 1